ncbi:leucine Rich Repeat [Seminavis robusta]|uniref:Leucine Rich Repeat n=1 Tax=Seminavis robusta TaxID=568900 RepID=A0A9N8H373_9STRA|nr:leucine Rich Repeat [Seminavis robusta]|eukprot:Sro32_g020990.1 leucine Rich Repeat (781) ;mRNA; r:127127-129469
MNEDDERHEETRDGGYHQGSNEGAYGGIDDNGVADDDNARTEQESEQELLARKMAILRLTSPDNGSSSGSGSDREGDEEQGRQPREPRGAPGREVDPEALSSTASRIIDGDSLHESRTCSTEEVAVGAASEKDVEAMHRAEATIVGAVASSGLDDDDKEDTKTLATETTSRSLMDSSSSSHNMDNNSTRTSTQRSSVASSLTPGAYSTHPTWRGSVTSSDGFSENDDEDEDDGLAIANVNRNGTVRWADVYAEAGLVQANPVAELPANMERAEPMDESDHSRTRRHHHRRKDSSLHISLLVALCCIVVAAAGLTILLSNSGNSTMPEKNAKNATAVMDMSNEDDPNQPWQWDLPFPPTSNTTLHVLTQDNYNGTCSTSKAYRWMKQDPFIANYSEERLCQRFVMAQFYYAMGGPEWTNQGGGTVTILTDAYKSKERFTSPKPSSAPTHPPPLGGRQLLRGQSNSMGGIQARGGFKSKETIEVNITSEPWLSYQHSECEWFSTAPIHNHVICYEDQRIRNVVLKDNNLVGTLPDDLFLLDSLEGIRLGRNKIRGPIPTQIGALTNLQGFQVFRNHLTGTVPSEIGLLSNSIAFLSIVLNELHGSLPSELWNLSKLQQLKVGKNEFTGSLPANIGESMPNLELFMAGVNQLTGTIPSSLGSLTGCIVLDISDNNLEGTLPTELGNLGNLTTLYAGTNYLSGTVPSELGLAPLINLNLEGNEALTGDFPPELSQLNQTVAHLLLKGTSITGTIPEQLCDIQELSFDCSPTLCGCDCPCNTTSL